MEMISFMTVWSCEESKEIFGIDKEVRAYSRDKGIYGRINHINKRLNVRRIINRLRPLFETIEIMGNKYRTRRAIFGSELNKSIIEDIKYKFDL